MGSQWAVVWQWAVTALPNAHCPLGAHDLNNVQIMCQNIPNLMLFERFLKQLFLQITCKIS